MRLAGSETTEDNGNRIANRALDRTKTAGKDSAGCGDADDDELFVSDVSSDTHAVSNSLIGLHQHEAT